MEPWDRNPAGRWRNENCHVIAKQAVVKPLLSSACLSPKLHPLKPLQFIKRTTINLHVFRIFWYGVHEAGTLFTRTQEVINSQHGASWQMKPYCKSSISCLQSVIQRAKLSLLTAYRWWSKQRTWRICKLRSVLAKVCVVVNPIDWICNNSHISDTQSQLFATRLAKGFLPVWPAPGCWGKWVT